MDVGKEGIEISHISAGHRPLDNNQSQKQKEKDKQCVTQLCCLAFVLKWKMCAQTSISIHE